MRRDLTTSGSANLWAFLLAISVILLATSGPAAAALDAKQQAELARIDSTLRSAEADLQSAQSSAGTAENPAQGSRLRLTQMRLESAVQKLNQAAEWLAPLPADDDAVAQAIARHAAALTVANQINAILNPPPADAPPAPAPAPGDKPQDQPEVMPAPREGAPEGAPDNPPAPNAPAPPLHYTQKDQLGNARFHLRDAQSFANRAAAVVAQIDAPDTTVVYRDVVGALESQARAEEKLANANKTLEPLPADHPDVAPVVAEARATGERMAATRERLVAAEAALGKLAKIENYPNYVKDAELLRELSRRYSSFQNTAQQPELMAQVIREDGTVLQEIQRIAQTYLPLVDQKTAEGEQIEKQFNYFQEQRGKFAAELGPYIESLKAGIDEVIAEVDRLAEEAVKNNRPAYFGPNSGIAQQYGFAEDKLLVLRAFGDEVAAPYAEKLAASRTKTDERAAAFREQIIQGNRLPADNYQGEDREAIIAIAIDGWSHQQKDAPIITARIPAQAWVRTTKWEWFDGAFYKIDSSRIQVQLIIRHDDRLAVVRPINVVRDHLAGDTLKGMPLWSFEDEVTPGQLMLLEHAEKK